LCGIAGFTHRNGCSEPERIRKATTTLVHRGPDQMGIFRSHSVSLGATRLKIIDPQSGDQALTTTDRDVTIGRCIFDSTRLSRLIFRQACRQEGEPYMNRKAWKSVLCMGVLALSLLSSNQLRAQVGSAILSGTVTDPSGKAVADAAISVKNVVTGRSMETQTDSDGLYKVLNLVPGDYEVSVSSQGFSTNVAKVTITQGAKQTMNLTLGAVLSLGDLGFSPTQTQGNAQDQARLDKRSHMLKIHQRLGLIDTAPLLATIILGTGAGGKSTSSTDRFAHLALGSVTGDLYFISAYYAIRAPKIPGTETRGPIRLHKALAWIHGPGMILTPILGAIAFDQKSKGERVHGIASAHGAVAIVTAAAYGASILSVSVKW
jgi:hypothetical protein